MARVAMPAVDGWFTTNTEEPTLIGQRCTACQTYVFPRAQVCCPNPHCRSTDFDDVPLSRRGKVWSYTDAQFQPPPPFVQPGAEHRPFAIAAVELIAEGLVILGQVVPGVGVDDLAVGDEVELVIDTLFTEDEREQLVWKWKPVGRQEES
jgi:uncharacterized OB-fold protein